MLGDYCTARAYLYFCEFQKENVEKKNSGCGLLVGEAKEAEVSAARGDES